MTTKLGREIDQTNPHRQNRSPAVLAYAGFFVANTMNDIGIIWLTKGQFALVDAEDYKWINQWKWHFNAGYACRSIYDKSKPSGQAVLLMHRLINKTPSGFLTDHKNEFKLDNRKSNLRNANASQNNYNRHAIENRTSRFKGVVWNKNAGKWQSQISINRNRKHLGLYLKESDAAHAYNISAIEICGEFACLNEIDSKYEPEEAL